MTDRHRTSSSVYTLHAFDVDVVDVVDVVHFNVDDDINVVVVDIVVWIGKRLGLGLECS